MHGNATKTSGGLTKSQLKYNKQGKIVSKKASALAKKNNRLVKAGFITRKGEFGISGKMRGGVGEWDEHNDSSDDVHILYDDPEFGNKVWCLRNILTSDNIEYILQETASLLNQNKTITMIQYTHLIYTYIVTIINLYLWNNNINYKVTMVGLKKHNRRGVRWHRNGYNEGFTNLLIIPLNDKPKSTHFHKNQQHQNSNMATMHYPNLNNNFYKCKFKSKGDGVLMISKNGDNAIIHRGPLPKLTDSESLRLVCKLEEYDEMEELRRLEASMAA